MTKNRKLAEYIEPSLGDTEMSAQCGRIEARLGAPRADTRVTVAVEQGAVEAETRAGGERTRIAAGETWSTVKRAAAPAADSATLGANAAPPSPPPQGEAATDTVPPKNLEPEKSASTP